VAKKVATNGYLKLDVGGSNEVDVSANLESLDFEISGKSVNVTSMGDTWEDELAGLKKWTASANIWYVDTANGQDEKLLNIAGTQVAVAFGPDGSTPAGTTPVWSGTATVGGLKGTISVGEAIKHAITLSGSGSVTRTDS